MDQLVHAARAERRSHGVDDGAAGVDVADQLRLSLTCVGAVFQQYNLRLLQTARLDQPLVSVALP